ncbi:F-box protein SKIP1-like [Iris pallida]|uniref:F-box protein SKIP1-like n=1 Tax=Iris pallida TaxID=29817 RepID=A0AAX6IHP3_IRIPA|nr:F-box protein SKIP1-like [Iris pallida]
MSTFPFPSKSFLVSRSLLPFFSLGFPLPLSTAIDLCSLFLMR